MTNFAQFLLVVVIATLTLLITVVAIQVLHLLHDARQAIQKFNRILDNTHTINQFLTQAKDQINPPQDQIIESPPSTPSIRRFFHRSGLPLRPS